MFESLVAIAKFVVEYHVLIFWIWFICGLVGSLWLMRLTLNRTEELTVIQLLGHLSVCLGGAATLLAVAIVALVTSDVMNKVVIIKKKRNNNV